MASSPTIIRQQDNAAPLPRLAYNLPEPTAKNMFSLKYWRLAVRRINSLLNMQSVDAGRTGNLIVSDANTVLPVNSSGATTGTGNGNMRYMFNVPETAFTPALYDATKDYAVYDVVYTNPDSNTRISWVCEIANGPHQPAGAQAPTWPEPGTVYWRALARFFFNSASNQVYRPGFDNTLFAAAIDSISGDVSVTGQFATMDLVDSAGNSSNARRNSVAELTTLLSPKVQHYWTPYNSGPGAIGAGCIYNSSGQLYVVGNGDGLIQPKWNDFACGNTNGAFAVRLNNDGTVDTAFAPSSAQNSQAIGYFGQNSCALDGSGNLVYVTGTSTAGISLSASNGLRNLGFVIDQTNPFPATAIIPFSGNFWVGANGTTEGVRIIDQTTGGTAGGFTSQLFSWSGSGGNAAIIVWGLAIPAGGGSVIAVGHFDGYNGNTHNRIVKISNSGAEDATFLPIISGGDVRCILAQANGQILIGGDFNTVNGASRVGWARLNSNGTTDTGFVCNTNGSVYAIAQNSRGETIIGGTFTSVAGLTRHRVARVDASGNVLGI